LRDEIGIEPKYLEYEQLNSLREQYEEYLKKETKCSKCFKETTKGRLYLFCIKTDLDFCSEFCHSESMIDLKKYLTNDEEKTFQYFQQWGRLISICEDIVD
jgi:hypothetical protein